MADNNRTLIKAPFQKGENKVKISPSPIIPFEPILTEQIPRGDNWIAQVKWDGVRMLTYFDGNKVRLINRRLNERTEQYPEFLFPQEYCAASSFILDGEFIAFDEKKPAFHEIMKRDSLRRKQSIELSVSRIPVTYMIFDVLFVNGEWVVSKTLGERQKILNDIIKPSNRIQVVENFTDAENLFQLMTTHKMEGIISKNLESSYLINGKDGRWLKRKTNYDLFAVIGGITYRTGIVNSLLLGIYVGNSLLYIGHSGTGKLTRAQWLKLTRQMEPLVTLNCPFANRPERHKDAFWVKPEVVVKVQFMEWTPSRTMRHSSIQSIMENVSVSECHANQI